MGPYRKILLLLDLSDASDQVALACRQIAAYSDAEILALHVVDFVPVEPMGETLMPSVEIETELMQRARARLDDMVARLGMARTTCRVAAGITKAEILRVAEREQVDLIVLGSRERHGLAILVNFTEDTVLHAAHCDVLAIRLK
jgi:universal stress protein A